jgi:hypothetical protein
MKKSLEEMHGSIKDEVQLSYDTVNFVLHHGVRNTLENILVASGLDPFEYFSDCIFHYSRHSDGTSSSVQNIKTLHL